MFNPLKHYYQVECLDKNGEKHYWRFFRDKEGFIEALHFAEWLLNDRHNNEGYHSFNLTHDEDADYRVVTTCFGDFVIETDTNGECIARSTNDDDFYYHIDAGMGDDEIKKYFLELKEFEK